MVEGYDGVEEHEEAFWDAEDVFQGSCRFGLEVSDAVVAYVADCTASEGRKSYTWDVGDTVLGEFGFEEGEGIDGRAVGAASLYDFARV